MNQFIFAGLRFIRSCPHRHRFTITLSLFLCVLAGRLHVPEHEDAVDRHGGAPEVPARHPPDPRLPPPLPLPSLLTVLPLEQTRKINCQVDCLLTLDTIVS